MRKKELLANWDAIELEKELKKIEYIDRYKIRLYFKNGKVKIFDMEDRLRTARNLFIPLKDLNFFKKIKCEDGTVVWPNGVDLCPDVLYKLSKDVPVERKHPKKAIKTTLRKRKKLNPT